MTNDELKALLFKRLAEVEKDQEQQGEAQKVDDVWTEGHLNGQAEAFAELLTALGADPYPGEGKRPVCEEGFAMTLERLRDPLGVSKDDLRTLLQMAEDNDGYTDEQLDEIEAALETVQVKGLTRYRLPGSYELPDRK